MRNKTGVSNSPATTRKCFSQCDDDDDDDLDISGKALCSTVEPSLACQTRAISAVLKGSSFSFSNPKHVEEREKQNEKEK